MQTIIPASALIVGDSKTSLPSLARSQTVEKGGRRSFHLLGRLGRIRELYCGLWGGNMHNMADSVIVSLKVDHNHSGDKKTGGHWLHNANRQAFAGDHAAERGGVEKNNLTNFLGSEPM